MRNGTPYRFVGLNMYSLAGGPQTKSCALDGVAGDYPTQLETLFSEFGKMGTEVVRLWAFQNFAGTTGVDFSFLDQVIKTAKAHGMLVVLTLENQWQDCTYPQDGAKLPTWYATGYTSNYGYGQSLTAYTKALVTHFKDEPTILMWQLMNEAESTDFASLQSFTHNMAGVD